MPPCAVCALDHPSGQKFCRGCGSRLSDAASSPEVMPEVPPRRNRRPWVTGGAILVMMLLGGAGWYFLQSRISVSSRPDEGLASVPATDAAIVVTPASASATEKIGEPIVRAPAIQASVEEAASTEVPRRAGAERSMEVQAAQDVASERRQQGPVADDERLKAEAVQAQRRLAAAFEGDATKADSETPQRREEGTREAEKSKAEAEAQQRGEDAAWAAAAEAAHPPAEEPRVQTLQIPIGTEVNVRLATKLNSGSLHVEDRFDALTQEDLKIGERTLVPAGSVMRGIVSAVEPASRTNRTARMTLAFDLLTVDGRAYPIRAQVTQVLAGSGLKGEATRIAVGAGIGGLIGGILGGAKGAIAGTLIGSGGSIAATEGKQVELPQGTVLRTRIDAPVQIDVK